MATFYPEAVQEIFIVNEFTDVILGIPNKDLPRKAKFPVIAEALVDYLIPLLPTDNIYSADATIADQARTVTFADATSASYVDFNNGTNSVAKFNGDRTYTLSTSVDSTLSTLTLTTPDLSGAKALFTTDKGIGHLELTNDNGAILDSWVILTGATASIGNSNSGVFVGPANAYTSIGGLTITSQTATGLGVNVASPTTNLHVNGGVRFQNLATSPATTSYILHATDVNGNLDFIDINSLVTSDNIYNTSDQLTDQVRTVTLFDATSASIVKFSQTFDIFNVQGDGSVWSGMGSSTNSVYGLGAGLGRTVYTNCTIDGAGAFEFLQSGGNNTAVGYRAARNNPGGTQIISINQSTYLGTLTKPSNNSVTNENVVGYLAEGRGSNTIQLGNSSIIGTYANSINAISSGTLATDYAFKALNNAETDVLFTINEIGQVIPNGVGSISTNTILGEAGSSITTGGFNSVLGHQALDSITTQSYNVAIGHQAMQTATTSQSVAVGHTALQKSSGINNTAVGVNSMTNNTTGQGNTAVGHTSLNDNTTGIHNTAVGFESLSLVTTNGYNTAVGHSAGKSSTGQQNTFLGFSTGRNTTGNFCTFSGVNSGYENTSGQYNTFYGYGSGRGITTGSYNTVIGAIGGLTSTTSNNIIISDGQANRGLTKDVNDNIYFGDASALATTATDGFTYIRGGAGAPTGVPATSITGHVPMYYDDTNQVLYIYSGGVWNAH